VREGREDRLPQKGMPELARMGEGMIEHKRAGVGELSSDSSSSESSDSKSQID
jgi:hypothetical protein